MHIATATAPGSTHINPGQPGKLNNQDALVHRTFERGHVVVLCDGCSAQPYSGTGADIGTSLIAKVLLKQLEKTRADALDWAKIQASVVHGLGAAAFNFASDGTQVAFETAIIERFLFTAMILIVDENVAVVASFGDGIALIDKDLFVIEAPILNSPPYLGYLLLSNTAYKTPQFKKHLAFSVVATVDITTLQKGIIVGTDGLKPLIGEDLHHPALVQPKALQRWINTQTAEQLHSGSFIPGKCSDDVSLVIFRTEEAQQRLFEERRPIAELKQQVSQLASELAITKRNLSLSNTTREQAQKQMAALEGWLRDAREKAERFDQLAGELDKLEGEIKTMRKRVGKSKQGSLGQLLDTILGLVGQTRPQEEKGATVSKVQLSYSITPGYPQYPLASPTPIPDPPAPADGTKTEGA